MAGREWQQEPAASGHIMSIARKQGTESKQKSGANHKISRPHLPAPVTPFCQWGSSSSSSIAFAKGHQLAGAHAQTHEPREMLAFQSQGLEELSEAHQEGSRSCHLPVGPAVLKDCFLPPSAHFWPFSPLKECSSECKEEISW